MVMRSLGQFGEIREVLFVEFEISRPRMFGHVGHKTDRPSPKIQPGILRTPDIQGRFAGL